MTASKNASKTASKKLLVCAAVFATAPVAAAPLAVVTVAAPDINCVFNPTCKITVTDTGGNIPIPGIAGTARLQSRTFNGAKGAPAAGKRGYMYRMNLTQAYGIVDIPCVNALKVDFGPAVKLQYNKAGGLDDVFVVTKGGIGTIGLASADQTGNVITFNFSKPVCGGGSPGKGDTSHFFGLTSNHAPKAITAQVQVVGGPLVSVAARAPNY